MIEPPALSPTLICPYPLMEEGALAWAIILSQQVYGLHPFPLRLNGIFRNLADFGLYRFRTSQRTQEEIRNKDLFLRGIQAYVAGMPEAGLLQFLNQTRFKEEETLDELVLSLREGQKAEDSRTSLLTGSYLLCLIHHWLDQEWAIDQSLARAENLEAALVRGWQEDFGEGSSGTALSPQIVPGPLKEIPCPLALTTWRYLRKSLFPESWPLMTTQQWIWADIYGIDPSESLDNSVSLPELRPRWLEDREMWEIQGKGSALRRALAGLLAPEAERGEKMAEFRESLGILGLPTEGHYRLILPPHGSEAPRSGEIVLLLIRENA